MVIVLWHAGYVHGKHPEICPNDCKPDPQAGHGESPKQTLIREAMEFQVCHLLPHEGQLSRLPPHKCRPLDGDL